MLQHFPPEEEEEEEEPPTPRQNVIQINRSGVMDSCEYRDRGSDVDDAIDAVVAQRGGCNPLRMGGAANQETGREK